MLDAIAGYKTGSGNLMTMSVHGRLYERKAIPIFDNKDDLPGLCSYVKQCKGFNGGCPPYSPYFMHLKPNESHLYVICVEFDMAWAITYSGWWKGVSAPGLYILVYADRLTMNYIQRIIANFENVGYYSIGVSNCPGCRPKDCTVIRGELCAKPKKRRFSVESVGIHCGVLHRDIFDAPLPWWYRTKEYMPTRMYRYAGVFASDDSIGELDSLLEYFVLNDKSYDADTSILTGGGKYRVAGMIIPEGCDEEGEEYIAYRIPIERMAV